MKNVIVLAVNKERYAVELRWVREVFTLGHVTPVPHAPPTISGVTNFRGSIMTVLDLPLLLGLPGPATGDGAVVVETEDVRAALRVDNVAEVATLRENDAGELVDSRGRTLRLLSPPALLATALSAMHAMVEPQKSHK